MGLMVIEIFTYMYGKQVGARQRDIDGERGRERETICMLNHLCCATSKYIVSTSAWTKILLRKYILSELPLTNYFLVVQEWSNKR